MSRVRPSYLAVFVVLIVIVAGACEVTGSTAAVSKKPTYVVCLHRHGGAKSMQRPHDCQVPTSLRRNKGLSFRLFDFRGLRWRTWGSAKATATGVFLDSKSHARTKVRFSVSGLVVCKYRVFYSKILIERPRRVNPRHDWSPLPVPTCPGRPSY